MQVMTVNMPALIDVQIKEKLEGIQSKWKEKFKEIEKMELSFDEAKRIRAGFELDFDDLKLKFDWNENMDLVYRNLMLDLNLAIQKANQNYRHYKDKQNLEKLKIIGTIIAAIVGIILSVSYYFHKI
jgi:hypothetical protein